MTGLDEVVDWIGTVDEDTLDVLLAALQSRHDDLHEERASRVRQGAQVVIHDVDPRFLEGLSGEVVAMDDEEGVVDVLLTHASTGRLRFCGQRDYDTGAQMRFLLEGVPASCCYTPTAMSGVSIQPA